MGRCHDSDLYEDMVRKMYHSHLVPVAENQPKDSEAIRATARVVGYAEFDFLWEQELLMRVWRPQRECHVLLDVCWDTKPRDFLSSAVPLLRSKWLGAITTMWEHEFPSVDERRRLTEECDTNGQWMISETCRAVRERYQWYDPVFRASLSNGARVLFRMSNANRKDVRYDIQDDQNAATLLTLMLRFL